jgi:predicted metal-dependent HD superfamily phosphohydrolase
MTLLCDAIRIELMRIYEGGDRHYHGQRHIDALLVLKEAHAALLTDPDAVEAAIWFHDAVYEPRRNDNEARSAAMAISRLAGKATGARIASIERMILATTDHVLPELADPGASRDCALFLDMDLAILGSSEEVFAAYEQAVRREYAFVAEPAWRLGRAGVLQGLLGRPSIYSSPQFRASHERTARRNIAHALWAIAHDGGGRL